jgi:hypothetical protein
MSLLLTAHIGTKQWTYDSLNIKDLNLAGRIAWHFCLNNNIDQQRLKQTVFTVKLPFFPQLGKFRLLVANVLVAYCPHRN